ncbi:IS1400 transposase A [Yersinia mollaretii]|nr:IS1400 transposase A [Yersinia mollaretii]CQH03768.1 IS1400 transposase A [Yersinia mollaretii]
MHKIRFTEHQIIAVLKSIEAGRTIKDVCCEAAVHSSLFHIRQLHNSRINANTKPWYK